MYLLSSTCICVLQHVRKIFVRRIRFFFFSSYFVSSVTAVSFVLIISSLAACFRGDFFSPSYCCVYMLFPGIDFYSRIIVTANPQQPPLDLEHYYKSLSTFCAYLATLEDATISAREVCECSFERELPQHTDSSQPRCRA